MDNRGRDNHHALRTLFCAPIFSSGTVVYSYSMDTPNDLVPRGKHFANHN